MMKMRTMKYCITLVFLSLFLGNAMAQQQTAAQLQATAKTLMQQGDLDNAIKTLERAREQSPTDIEVLKDLSYASFIKKDYSRAIEVGKEAVANPVADAQAYQVLGLSYKAIALYKEAAKLYKTALLKFPNDGMLFNENGELLALDNKSDEAIAEWEKGIRADPSYNVNYYNATMYYVHTKNWLRVVLYGELFVNLESYTERTENIKGQIFHAYQSLFAPGYIRFLLNAKTTTVFEKAILATLESSGDMAKDGISKENLTSIRTRFILEWLQDKDKTYPFRLFNHQQYLLNQGLFEAYDQWLFGDVVNADAYHIWQNTHPKEYTGFKTFQESRVFKIPTGQYYFSR